MKPLNPKTSMTEPNQNQEKKPNRKGKLANTPQRNLSRIDVPVDLAIPLQVEAERSGVTMSVLPRIALARVVKRGWREF